MGSEHGDPIAAAGEPQGQVADEGPRDVAGETRVGLGEEKEAQGAYSNFSLTE
jgi:hypothetical protein